VQADTIPIRPPNDPPPARKRRRQKLPPLLTGANGVARMLDSGLRTIRGMDAAGKLPKPIRLGGKVLWSIDELKAWIAAGAPPRDVWEARKAIR